MVANPLVAVEPVSGRVAFRRFVEMPFALHRGDPRWAPFLAAEEKARLVPRRAEYFEQGDGEYFIVRRAGRPCGRITAHIEGRDATDGWFGFFAVDDDDEAAAALVDAARDWLRDQGATSIAGPASFRPGDEPGVQVAGYDVAGMTARPWHPEWYARGLAAAGLAPLPGTDQPAWRLPTTTSGVPGDVPHVVQYAKSAGGALLPTLTVATAEGTIVAVADVAPALRVSPLELARRAKRGAWETAVVTRVDGDPAVLVPLLRAAAGAAGYTSVISPWSPDPGEPPLTVHRLYGAEL